MLANELDLRSSIQLPMFLYFTLTAVILFISNFLLIKRSLRKKRYGLFPLYVTGGLIALLLLFTGIIRISLHATHAPEMSGFARMPHAMERYEEAQSLYQRNKEEDDDRLEQTAPYLSIGLKVIKIQVCIALVFVGFALLIISGRNNFYYTMFLLNLLLLLTAFMLDQGIT